MKKQTEVTRQISGVLSYLGATCGGVSFVLIGITPDGGGGRVEMGSHLCDEHLIDTLKQVIGMIEEKRPKASAIQ